MTYVEKIVEAFGGVRPMAKKLGYPISTVSSWKVRGSIPDEHKPTVLEVAFQSGFQLSKEDFFPCADCAVSPSPEGV